MFVWTFEGVIQAIFLSIIFLPFIIIGILWGISTLFEKIYNFFNGLVK